MALHAMISAQSEIVRFTYYTFKGLQGVVGHLRYNLFLVVQPIGTSVELIFLYQIYKVITDTIVDER